MASFHVTVLSRQEVHSLPGTWAPADLRRVLELLDADDIGEIAEGDLEELCLMALQDAGIRRAGEVVLEAVFGDTMRSGVRQNLVDDLEEDQPWNDFAEVSQQRGIFIAVCLLHKAFPTRYGTPDACRVTVGIRAPTDAAFASIAPSQPAWLVRLIAFGLDGTSFIHRVYDDELKAGPFPEAVGFVWDVVDEGVAGEEERFRRVSVTASTQLLGALYPGQQFKAVL